MILDHDPEQILQILSECTVRRFTSDRVFTVHEFANRYRLPTDTARKVLDRLADCDEIDRVGRMYCGHGKV